MNPEDIINFDDYLFVEHNNELIQEYNSLHESNNQLSEVNNHNVKSLQRNLSMSPKPKLLPKPQPSPRTDVNTATPIFSREPSTSNETQEDEQLMSIICDSMMNKLKISKNYGSREDILQNTDKDLNEFQRGLTSHNSFLQSTAQQLKSAFETIKHLVADNEILSKELSNSKADFNVLKTKYDEVCSSSSSSYQQSLSAENDSHLKALQMEEKNDKLRALYLDSSDKVRSVLDENNCFKLQLNEAKEELNKRNTEIDLKNSEIGDLQERLNLLTCQSETYKNDYEEQRRTNNNIVAENETLKAHFRTSNRDSELFSAVLDFSDSDVITRCPICQVEFRSYDMLLDHVDNCQN